MNEIEKLRELLREIRRHNSSGLTRDTQVRIDAALSQQAEPTDTRPAQTEQQPVAWTWQGTLERLKNGYCPEGEVVWPHKGPGVPIPLYAAPIAQAAPQTEQQPAGVVLPPQCTDKSKPVKYRKGWNSCLSEVFRLNRANTTQGGEAK